MKKCFLFLVLIILFSCEDEYDNKHPGNGYTPVLLSRENLEKSIEWKEAKSLENPGKIYLKNNYLFINEKYEGIHVYDNNNPSSPENLGFIQIPGNIDIAIKGNILYADNAVDLVAIDVSSIDSIIVTHREKNVFSEIYPPGMVYMPYEYNKSNRPENTVIVDWIDSDKIE